MNLSNLNFRALKVLKLFAVRFISFVVFSFICACNNISEINIYAVICGQIYALRQKVLSIRIEMCMQFLLFLCRPHNLRILQHKEDNYSDNHTVILTNLIFPAKQFTQLFAVRFIRFLRYHRDSRLFPVIFMRFFVFLFLCA